jgi:ABC-type amino acid transport system permease subunit
MDYFFDVLTIIAMIVGLFFGLALFSMLLTKIIDSLGKRRASKVRTWMDKVVTEIQKFEDEFWKNRYLLFWIFWIMIVSLALTK